MYCAPFPHPLKPDPRTSKTHVFFSLQSAAEHPDALDPRR